MKTLILAAVAALALASCGGDDDGGNPTLQPAGEARTSTAAAQPELRPVAVGDTLSIGDLEVTLSAIERVDEETLDVTARIENPTDREVSPPDFNTVCADGSGSGRKVDSREGAISFDTIPARSFEEGTILMAVPAGCDPIAVRVNATGIFEGGLPAPGLWELP